MVAQPIPVRMLNEYAYCPRLFHLMHVEGRWADNRFTEEGREVHRRVDRLDHVLPDPGSESTEAEADDDRPAVSRSVSLGSARLGLTAKLDLVAMDGDEAVPVETKRGRVPNNPERSWEPERVQLMAQGLLLREHGYDSDHGVLYFAGSRTRVDIPFDSALESRTLELLSAARQAQSSTLLPPPLDDSPKCHACSLSGICLPDETLALQAVPAHPQAGVEASPPIRRLYPPREEALPLYVQEQGARVGKSRKVITIKRSGEEIGRARLKDVSQLVLLGNVTVSAQALHLLCEASVPIVHFSTGHWFYGITQGMGLRNAYDRRAQFEASADSARCLEFAKAVVEAKGFNQRTLIGRNLRPRPKELGKAMKALLRKVPHAESMGELLGLEGGIAAHYFGAFGNALKPRDFESEWDFESRNRRPPLSANMG